MIALVVIKSLLLFLLVSFLIVIVIELLGKVTHGKVKAARSNSYFLPASQLFEYVTDIEQYPHWRQGVMQVKATNDNHTWQEYFGKKQCLQQKAEMHQNGTHTFHTHSPTSKPFQFNRTYTIYRKDKLSFLKIEDHLHFSNPALRIYANFFYNHSKVIDQELKNLDRILT